MADGTIRIVNKLSDQKDNFVDILPCPDGRLGIKAPNSFFFPVTDGFNIQLQ